MDLSSLPRVQLAHLPTPLEPMEALASRVGAETEGLLLDPVYTGKAMAGMLALLGASQKMSRDRGPTSIGATSKAHTPLQDARDVIFLHTGGSPALFAYPELFRTSEVAR